MLNNLFFVIKKSETYDLKSMFPADDTNLIENSFKRELSDYIDSVWTKVLSFELKIEEDKDSLKKSTKESIKKFFNVILS